MVFDYSQWEGRRAIIPQVSGFAACWARADCEASGRLASLTSPTTAVPDPYSPEELRPAAGDCRPVGDFAVENARLLDVRCSANWMERQSGQKPPLRERGALPHGGDRRGCRLVHARLERRSSRLRRAGAGAFWGWAAGRVLGARGAGDVSGLPPSIGSGGHRWRRCWRRLARSAIAIGGVVFDLHLRAVLR